MSHKCLGQLYAVGVGTGDSELLTLKAVRLIKVADVVAILRNQRSGGLFCMGNRLRGDLCG
ncbi:SAM-dependent methyltransferase [Vibrio sp. PP-XX7]